MIAYLTGTAQNISQRKCILMTESGVGYLVFCKNSSLNSFQIGKKLSLYIHTQVKQDEIALFGFAQEAELRFFETLIQISGIGAKTALNILEHPLPLLQKAIATENVSLLSSIPGIGTKTASRILLELQGKILPSAEQQPESLKAVEEEALDALFQLGYDKARVIRFINECQQSFESAEELVRTFLQKA